jgi:hypothetical protein
MKTSNKKGLNFLILNKEQDSSSEDRMDNTISHEHISAVQEDEQETESDSEDDMDEEEGTSTDDEDKETASDDDDYEGFAFLQEYVLCSI